MQISVVIPVFNAASYVAQAVESALAQPETAEVILVEDGSSDDSITVGRALTAQYENVKLLRHKGGENKGAGASRNLGITQAQFDWIAFLDADDYFLPERFMTAKDILASDPECDGVYEAVGKNFESVQAKQRWEDADMSTSNLTTINAAVLPEDLFRYLFTVRSGYFHLDGLVIKRSLAQAVGGINENLPLHQDTAFMFKLAYLGKLMPGRIDEPVAIRRIHEDNRISASRSARKIYQYRIKMWREIYRWFRKRAGKDEMQLIINAILSYSTENKHFNSPINAFSGSRLNRKLRLILLFIDIPGLIFEPLYWQHLLPFIAIQ